MVAGSLLLAACGHVGPSDPASDGELQIVATTPILADLTRQVVGTRGDVHSLIPPGADPHTHEPSLRDVRSVVYADVAFTNYLLLEPHAIIKMVDANLPEHARNVSVAEASTKYGAEVIPLVENATLDTLWLGLRVRGTGEGSGADRSSEVEISIGDITGPGQLSAYLTESFGRPKVLANSPGGRSQPLRLPTNAHTHMSWAFSQPGTYTMDVHADLFVRPDSQPQQVATDTITFVVGTNPAQLPEFADRTVLEHGHADIAADVDSGEIYLWADEEGGGDLTQRRYDPESTVIWVPPKALLEVPPTPAFRFLGDPGQQIHQLPQAVLGAHVHGEIDPHLWLNPRNTQAYVQLIRDTLSEADPEHAMEYRENADKYLAELRALDDEVATAINTIPQRNRQLVTTHDAYGYLAKAYGLQVAGFVSPHPGAEPSLAQRRKLAATIRQLKVPAVFVEPTNQQQSQTLRTVAEDAGVRVCEIRSDTFDREVTSYVELMRANAHSLQSCLGTPS